MCGEQKMMIPCRNRGGEKNGRVGRTKISDWIPGLFQPFLCASFQQWKVFRASNCPRPQFFKCAFQKRKKRTSFWAYPPPSYLPSGGERWKHFPGARAFCDVTVKGYTPRNVFFIRRQKFPPWRMCDLWRIHRNAGKTANSKDRIIFPCFEKIRERIRGKDFFFFFFLLRYKINPIFSSRGGEY